MSSDPELRPVATCVTELLRAYSGCRRLAEDPPASITLPRHGPLSAIMGAIHRALRPMWGAERWTASRIRQSLDALDRALLERLAIEEVTGDTARGREAVEQFKASLPPPGSRLKVVAAFVATVVLAQVILGIVTDILLNLAGATPELVEALGSLETTPDVNSATALLRALARSNLDLLFAFVVAVALGAYIVCRASASGYRMAGLVLNRVDGLGVPRRSANLTRATNELGVARLESAIFARLGAKRPREFPVDLAVKALPAAALLFLGFYGLRTLTKTTEDIEFSAFAALGALRLLWLARASHKRDAGLAWLSVPAMVLALASLTFTPIDRDDEQTKLPRDQQLSFTLSMQQDLSGVDLRGRDLSNFYLHGKNLSFAALADADLENANLVDSRLRGADLSGANLFDADLSGADMRGATLTGAAFSNTILCGADLRETDLRGDLSTITSDGRTRWPDVQAPPGVQRGGCR